MGAICSKPSTLSGGHTLGPSASSSPGQPRTSTPRTSTQGRSGRSQQTSTKQRPQARDRDENRRSQAAAAAEQRKKDQTKRGVNAANPNSGRLAARLEASRTAPPAPEPTRRQDTLIDDWRN